MIKAMKKARSKKLKRPEFEGKSREYRDGYEMSEWYFNHLLKGGNRTGGAPFRIFVEAVAGSIRNGEKINQNRVEALECILKWNDSEFNRGVHDLLVKKVKEYRSVELIDEAITNITGDGSNEMPQVR